jgi:hypothetical protein
MSNFQKVLKNLKTLNSNNDFDHRRKIDAGVIKLLPPSADATAKPPSLTFQGKALRAKTTDKALHSKGYLSILTIVYIFQRLLCHFWYLKVTFPKFLNRNLEIFQTQVINLFSSVTDRDNSKLECLSRVSFFRKV